MAQCPSIFAPEMKKEETYGKFILMPQGAEPSEMIRKFFGIAWNFDIFAVDVSPISREHHFY